MRNKSEELQGASECARRALVAGERHDLVTESNEWFNAIAKGRTDRVDEAYRAGDNDLLSQAIREASQQADPTLLATIVKLLSGPLSKPVRVVAKKAVQEMADRVIKAGSGSSTGRLEPDRIISAVVQQLREELSNNFQSALSGPKLDNYRGYFCATVFSGRRQLRPISGVLQLAADEKFRVEGWFQPAVASAAFSDKVSVLGGNQTASVQFEIVLHTEGIQVDEPCQMIVAAINSPSPRAEFNCVVDRRTTRALAIVQAFQKNRLVQSLRLPIGIASESKS